jgi:hypothetical protein
VLAEGTVAGPLFKANAAPLGSRAMSRATLTEVSVLSCSVSAARCGMNLRIKNGSFRVFRPSPALHVPLRIGQPRLVHYLFRKHRIHQVRADELLKRIGDLLVFVLATLGSFLRQISLLNEVAKQLREAALRESARPSATLHNA